MGWLARSLGQAGADAGQAYDINQTWQQRAQQMKLEAARQKMAELMLPIQLQELKGRIAEMTQPKPEGLYNLPGGGTAAATFTPGKGYGSQVLNPGADKDAIKRQIQQIASTAPKEYQSSILAAADSIDAGEDPLKALDRAQTLSGQAAGKASTAGRLLKGDPIPSKDSVTGYARPYYDQAGNLVKVVPNIVIPGLTARVTEGWFQTTDDDGNVIVIPKTTTSRPAGTSATPSAGGTPTAGGPQGSRIIGHRDTAIQRDAVKSAQQARDAFTNYSEGLKNSQTNNPRTNIALVIAAAKSTIAGGGGRLNSAEIEQQLKAGSFPEKVERWYQMAATGTLPDDQRQQILALLKNDYDAKRASAQQDWEFAYPGKALPPWLQPTQSQQGGNQGSAAASLPQGYQLDKH